MATKEKEELLTAISLVGFKSILIRQSVAIAPLTIFSGANSSGKSSFAQALLVLKQTLQSSYDPGAIMLNGPNVRMTSTEQMFSKALDGKAKKTFSIDFLFGNKKSFGTTYAISPTEPGGVSIKSAKRTDAGGKSKSITINSTSDEISDYVKIENIEININNKSTSSDLMKTLKINRSRCFLNILAALPYPGSESGKKIYFDLPTSEMEKVRNLLQNLIHVPGLRGNPERTYATTAIGESFPGRFENYVASIILEWQRSNDINLKTLIFSLSELGLTSGISAKKINDTEVELRVNRIRCSVESPINTNVSIADVGFGVSQALPVLVGLLVAKKGQIILIEQPELHLHPRAQSKLSEIIARAVKRGVIVIVETHSNLLLLGIQTLVASDVLSDKDVALNWFSINQDGVTSIKKGSVDRLGSFGEWPTDFMETSLQAEDAYLNAIENRLTKSRHEKQ